jgi:hypothetical protein
MTQGGSLDQETRRKMTGDISRRSVSGGKLEDLVPQDLARHIEGLRKSKSGFSQVDKRVTARKGGSYEGATRVSGGEFDPQLKDIPRPASPPPESRTGRYHSAHTAPFSLAGGETNRAKTVNAPSWANVTVDGHIEKKAKEKAKTGEEVVHFRYDTHDRSTVGFVRRKQKRKEWEMTSAQYARKLPKSKEPPKKRQKTD